MPSVRVKIGHVYHGSSWDLDGKFTFHDKCKKAKKTLYSHLVLRSVAEGNERHRFCFINQIYWRERNRNSYLTSLWRRIGS